MIQLFTDIHVEEGMRSVEKSLNDYKAMDEMLRYVLDGKGCLTG